MSDNIFYKIEKRLKDDKFLAIDVIDPVSSRTLAGGKFYNKILNDFVSVEDFLKSFYKQGIEKLLVFFKKKNGNTFKPRETPAIELNFKPSQKKTPMQENNYPVMQENTYGLGGAQILDIHSKAQMYEVARANIQKLENEVEKLKTKFENEKEANGDFKHNIRVMELDKKSLEEEIKRLQDKLDAKDRPIISDKGLEKVSDKILPEMLGAILAARSGAGLGSPAKQDFETLVVSEPKQKLINNIKLDDFTDEMANETALAAFGIYTNPEFTEELRVLIEKFNHFKN